ncbi:MAG: TolC family protein [Fuerstiella sp.]|nr:TolC family protein [Fuerstiella sp.]MCP4856350.1 TolC family protein [Fuerstiella sp.]
MRTVTCLLLTSMLLPTISGCKRSEWRQRADAESYSAIAEKQNDERWLLPRIDITPDPRSRFYDEYDNADCQPLPPDDPSAHQFMHCADGIPGYKKWHEHGDAASIENISWLSPYTELVGSADPVDGHAAVEISMLTLNDAVNLAYIHSRAYQTQLENVYLQALQLTGQRYLLGTRFHLSPVGSGGALFRTRNGRGLAGTPNQTLTHGFGIQRLMPGGAQWAVDVLNTVTWNSTTNAVSAPSLAWQLTQPFMADGGRRVVMENLTQAERNLLYQIRDMARFRQTLFAVIATSYLRLQQQQQRIINEENNIRLLNEQIEIAQEADKLRQVTVSDRLLRFPQGAEIPEELRPYLRYEPAGFLVWTGDMTAEHQQQLLAVSDDHLFQAAAKELIRYKDPDVVSQDVIDVITSLNRSESSLQGFRLTLADQLDAFKIELGLPPNITLTVDTAFLAPFELIAPELLSLESSLKEFAKELGPSLLPAPQNENDVERLAPEFEDLKRYVSQLQTLKNDLREKGLNRVKSDFQPVRDILEMTSDGKNLQNTVGRGFASEEERDRVLKDVARDLKMFRISEGDFETFAGVVDLLSEILSYDTEDAVLKKLDLDGNKSIGPSELPMGWSDLPIVGTADELEEITVDEFFSEIRDAAIAIREELLKISQALAVLQAGLRVDVIALNRFTLPGRSDTPDIEEVVRIGLANRRDLMNARAEVMDFRRDVEIAANQLLALMDLNVSGATDLIDGDTGVITSLDFKTPLDHVLERNTYRAALIAYQRARRDYMLAEDQVKQEIRDSWRQLMVAEQQLEIDRQALRNSARAYDTAVTSPQQSSFSLLNALGSLLAASNGLVGRWVTYETNRLNIYRDMGIMQVDSTGVWEDKFYLPGGTGHEIMPAPTELSPQPLSEAPSLNIPPSLQEQPEDE